MSIRYFLSALILTFATSLVDAQPNKYYELSKYIENPQLYSEYQEPPHVPLCPFDDENHALSGDFSLSPWFQSLNGHWRFKWYSTPFDVPDRFWEVADTAGNFGEITVPGTWQMQGHGYKIYRNIPLEFAPYDPPRVPDHLNPTGAYVRNFDVPAGWSSRKVFLHFEGVKAAYWVWVNGRYVGFDKGSMTSGEWDVTSFVREGVNSIAVKVVRWSDGTYLEDQDMWRFSGIYRDVYLYATPKLHIRDLHVQTRLDQSFQDADLIADAFFMNYDDQQHNNYLLDVKLYDPEGREVFTKNLRVGTMLANDEKLVELSYKVDNPMKWSAEKPNLYKLLLIVKEASGQVTEIIEETVGFREITIHEAQLLVNGVPVKFKGVNRHEHDPKKGRTMTRELIEQDMKLMKQLNVNAIRTSHYPNDPDFYDLADQYGFYICDEVNAECHEGENYLASQSGWDAAFMDRTERVFHRDKNHPSVILWSTGNECGYGSIHDRMASYLKENDPGRPVYHQGNDPNGVAPYADVNGIRYPTPEHLRIVGRTSDRPVIMGEYSHAMGNALGGFDEYWEVIYSERSLQGGFIWDWVNQGLEFDLLTTPDLSPYHHQAILMGNISRDEGPVGQGIFLSGLDDFVEVYNDEVFNRPGQQVSLETWVYPRGYHDVNPFVSKGGSYEITQPHPDSVSFILMIDGRSQILQSVVPRNWDFNWHHILASYDGTAMRIYVDGEIVAQRPAFGNIDRSPHPVCVGKNHRKNHENQGWFISNYGFDQVRVYPRFIDIGNSGYYDASDDLANEAILWLNFEEVANEGKFLSYGATPQGSGTMDGVVSSYRVPQPEAWQMKQSHAPVFVEKIGRDLGQLTITNRFHFTDLSEVDASWVLLENDKSISSGNLRLETRPQETTTMEMPFKWPKFKAGASYIFRINFSLKRKNNWADRGHEFCFFEFPVENLEDRKDIIIPEATSGFTVEEEDDRMKISANDTYYEIDLTTGLIHSMQVEEAEIISQAMEFNTWRRPVMNEWSSWGIDEAAFWYKYGLDSLVHKVLEVSATASGFDLYIRFRMESRSFSHPDIVFLHTMTYDIYSTGDIIVRHQVNPEIELPNLYEKDWFPLAFLQKIGLKFILNENVETIEWYGKGPFETYPDRKTGAKTGNYEQMIDQIRFPYLIVQDFDNHTDVRWLALSSGKESGFMISSNEWFNYSIDPFINLEKAWYPFQLEKAKNPTLNIDHIVTGVGGTPVRVRPQYRAYPRAYEYSLIIRPFTRKTDFSKLSNVDY